MCWNFQLSKVQCWKVEASEVHSLTAHPSTPSPPFPASVCQSVISWKRKDDKKQWRCCSKAHKKGRWRDCRLLKNYPQNWQHQDNIKKCLGFVEDFTVWTLNMRSDYSRWKGDQWVWQQPTMSPQLKLVCQNFWLFTMVLTHKKLKTNTDKTKYKYENIWL